jgi:hypothetical protein
VETAPTTGAVTFTSYARGLLEATTTSLELHPSHDWIDFNFVRQADVYNVYPSPNNIESIKANWMK